MEYMVGIALSGVVVGFALLSKFDGDRAFYPTVLVVTATYYVLFAVMGGSRHALVTEALILGAFVLAAVLGFKKNLWLVTFAFAGHGLFDLCHHLMIDNPGVPLWWPGFCLAFDFSTAVLLAVLLVRRSNFPHSL